VSRSDERREIRPANSNAVTPKKPTGAGWRFWKSRAQSTKAGALFLSWDFISGAIVGIALGLIASLVPQLQSNGFAFMITLSGIGAAVAALVLAPMAMLLASLSPQFHALIERMRGGIGGVLLPFKQVAIVAVGACVTGLIVSVLAPLYVTTQWWAIWIAASIPIVLLVWAVAGCVQVTAYVIRMIEDDRKVRKNFERIEKAQGQSGSHAA
jgi:F0F1-type ATP synthase assembly protein I